MVGAGPVLPEGVGNASLDRCPVGQPRQPVHRPQRPRRDPRLGRRVRPGAKPSLVPPPAPPRPASPGSPGSPGPPIRPVRQHQPTRQAQRHRSARRPPKSTARGGRTERGGRGDPKLQRAAAGDEPATDPRRIHRLLGAVERRFRGQLHRHLARGGSSRLVAEPITPEHEVEPAAERRRCVLLPDRRQEHQSRRHVRVGDQPHRPADRSAARAPGAVGGLFADGLAGEVQPDRRGVPAAGFSADHHVAVRLGQRGAVAPQVGSGHAVGAELRHQAGFVPRRDAPHEARRARRGQRPVEAHAVEGPPEGVRVVDHLGGEEGARRIQHALGGPHLLFQRRDRAVGQAVEPRGVGDPTLGHRPRDTDAGHGEDRQEQQADA